jgi:hypothetical protein
MASPRARKFAFAILGAAAGLAVLASETLDWLQRGDPTRGGENVRWIAAGACLVAAAAARRMSVVEAKGFVVAALAFAASVLVDVVGYRVSGSLEGEWHARRALVRGVQDLVAFGLPVVLGSWWIGIPAGDLLRPSVRPVRDFATAIVAGLLLFPVLSLVTKATHAALDAWRGGHSHPWNGLLDAMRQTPLADQVTDEGALIAVRLGLTFPLLEVLLHGVLRQPFSRWGIVGFVTVTAVLAPPLLVQDRLSFFVFGGAVVTGIVAALGGSVVPGFAFWMALFGGVALWMNVLPAPAR